MPLTKERKDAIADKYGQHEEDRGSAAVQVALLTARIEELNDHFQDHPQDHAGRRGLLQMVGRRRRLLDYLRERDVERYRWLIEELDLRR